MQTVNMRALPDGGQRILEQIRDLETKLKEVKQMCDECNVLKFNLHIFNSLNVL